MKGLKDFWKIVIVGNFLRVRNKKHLTEKETESLVLNGIKRSREKREERWRYFHRDNGLATLGCIEAERIMNAL